MIKDALVRMHVVHDAKKINFKYFDDKKIFVKIQFHSNNFPHN